MGVFIQIVKWILIVCGSIIVLDVVLNLTSKIMEFIDRIFFRRW